MQIQIVVGDTRHRDVEAPSSAEDGEQRSSVCCTSHWQRDFSTSISWIVVPFPFVYTHVVAPTPREKRM